MGLNKLFHRAIGRSSVAGGSPLRLPLVGIHALYEIARLLRRPNLYWKGVETLFGGGYIAPLRTNWTNYSASAEGWKGTFVRGVLPELTDADTVLDMAGNKGVLSLCAAQLGKRTLLADINEASLDQARATAWQDAIPFSVALLDMCQPTRAGRGCCVPVAMIASAPIWLWRWRSVIIWLFAGKCRSTLLRRSLAALRDARSSRSSWAWATSTSSND